MPNDLAIEKVFKFVDHDQKPERQECALGRNGERDTDDDRVADEVADDWYEPKKERQANNHRRVRQMHYQNKDGRENGIDRRNDNLGAHHRSKTLKERREPQGDLIATK